MNRQKFTMGLVWHNCLSCPPEEGYNKNLVATDGEKIIHVEYDKVSGWLDRTHNRAYIPKELLGKYWWADLVQTVSNTDEFKL